MLNNMIIRYCITTQLFFLQIVNYGGDLVNLKISVSGLENSVDSSGSINTLLTSSQPQDENSFQNPKKVEYHRFSFQHSMFSTSEGDCSHALI